MVFNLQGRVVTQEEEMQKILDMPLVAESNMKNENRFLVFTSAEDHEILNADLICIFFSKDGLAKVHRVIKSFFFSV